MKLTSFQRLISTTLAVFFGLMFLLATEHRAYAYIDPGSGLLALQSIASVAAAAGYFMRRRIAALFGRKPEVEVAEPIAVQKDSTRTAA